MEKYFRGKSFKEKGVEEKPVKIIGKIRNSYLLLPKDINDYYYEWIE